MAAVLGETLNFHVRPIYHRLEDRVRTHVFRYMLAYCVEWHMRKAFGLLGIPLPV